MNPTESGSSDEAPRRKAPEDEQSHPVPQAQDTPEPLVDDDDAIREAQSRDAESPGAFIDDPSSPAGGHSATRPTSVRTGSSPVSLLVDCSKTATTPSGS